jgi:hypothetical protein
MSVIDVKYDWKRSGGLIRNAGGLSKKEIYTVKFDNKDNHRQRPFLAESAASSVCSIPAYGASHPYNIYLYVTAKTVLGTEGPCLFDVEVEYASGTIINGRNQPIAPWDEPPVVRWGSSVSNEKIDKDINGQAIVNSAKEPFDPPITEDVYDTTLTISENVKNFNDEAAAYYTGKVNSGTFYGKPPGSVRCVEYSSETAWFGKIKYYRIVKGFIIRLPAVGAEKGVKGWTKRILDQGFTVLAEPHIRADKPSILIMVKNGTVEERISEPALLDGKGQLLEPSAAGEPQPGHFLSFETIRAVSFSSLR